MHVYNVYAHKLSSGPHIKIKNLKFSHLILVLHLDVIYSEMFLSVCL